MSDALILEFTGASQDQYNAVNATLGIDPATGEGDWPEGLLSHAGGADAQGNLLVFEVWDNREAQAAFMDTRLGAALGQAGMPAPSRADWLTVFGQHAR